MRTFRCGLSLAATIAVLSPVSAQSGAKGDPTYSVSSNNSGMNAAMAKARQLLPVFWKHYSHPGPKEKEFALKVKFRDNGYVEHIWVGELKRNGAVVTGVIDNQPEAVHNVKLGQRVRVNPNDISDWSFFRGEKIVGNYTMRAELKTMKLSPDDAKKAKAMLADPR